MALKQRILIVDDDENIAELISLYLTKECFETKIVWDGENALKELKELRINNDASYKIILDTRETILDAYNGKSPISIQLKLNNFSYLPESAYDNLYQTIIEISEQQK